MPWERLALHLVDSQPSPPIEGWFGPMRWCVVDCLDPPISRARYNFFVRKLFQANQVSIPIKPSTPDRSRMVWMLANTKLKPNGPLICGLQRFSAPKPSNRADRFASNRISAHGSDSKVVDDWFVVPWDRVPNHFDRESRSPPIEGWFGGSRQQLLHIVSCGPNQPSIAGDGCKSTE